MSEVKRPCPGCGVERGRNVCCDPCWDRIPAKLPYVPGQLPRTWRRRIVQARMVRDWGTVERIIAAVRTWLTEHPAPQTISR